MSIMPQPHTDFVQGPSCHIFALGQGNLLSCASLDCLPLPQATFSYSPSPLLRDLATPTCLKASEGKVGA